jgi:CheY-like chemotaxis protein
MSLTKRTVRKKVRTTVKKVKRSPKKSNSIEQGPIEPVDHAPSFSIVQSLETSPGRANPEESTIEGWELSNLLLEFTTDNNRDSSPKPEADADGCTRFHIVEAEVYQPDVVSEAYGTAASLVDPSKWFEHKYADSADNPVELQQESSSEEESFDSPYATALEITPEDTSTVAVSSVPAGDVDEMTNEVVESKADYGQEIPRDERRRHPRQDSSDLVWVEYFDSSTECTGKEPARVENVGAGGMRVAVKSAPPELERVIVSYPYRGFESCAIVRSRYRGEDGQERLCVEFADREWTANATCARAENGSDEVNLTRKILLADDDSTFRRILGGILSKAGYDVVLAEDGEEALEKATSEKPDLVITDGLMPRLHGFQVCKAVKELNAETKVIMLTAIYTSPNYKWEAHNKFRADDIITKPCQIADLLRTIEKHIPPLTQVV